ncbi:TIR domain-containing protein [Mycobacterium parmense]|uniref:TIR domain-containing protein n=1 Tax=Mycobacterium parmense TaxID=185642 RepID=UPI0013747B5F|nr:TIR domain-containing protein [Mycobacterium parmense]MCV7353771.1 nucleotide-binding protein [Mycobacterium parmense]
MAGTDAYISELDALAEELSTLGAQGDSPEFREPYNAALRVIDQVEKSWSGSNLGYQARVYYGEFEPPPAHEAFSITSGLRRGGVAPTRWQVRGVDDVRDELRACGVKIDFDDMTTKETEARRSVTRHKGTITSILSSYLATHDDNYIASVKNRVEKASPPSAATFARALVPNRQYLTNDTRALNEGGAIAPHQQILGQLEAFDAPYLCALELADCARNAANHLRRAATHAPTAAKVQLGSRVFIGHGRSQQWRELKDFLQDRLGLHIDEFNRVPVAGTTTAARLSDMLNNAAFACLVMTAEDEMADGTKVARDNVIHEVGLFQGRLGFERAIVLLEEGCEEFSNITGLSQLRYPRGRISAIFEDLRAVLEREELL